MLTVDEYSGGVFLACHVIQSSYLCTELTNHMQEEHRFRDVAQLSSQQVILSF